MSVPKKGISNVDAETLLAIQEGNKEVISQMSSMLANTTLDIKEYINLHVSPVKDDVTRLRNDVADLYEKERSMRDRVGALEQRQSRDEGDRSGRDTVGGIKRAESELTWGKVAGMCAVVATVTGIVVYFI